MSPLHNTRHIDAVQPRVAKRRCCLSTIAAGWGKSAILDVVSKYEQAMT